MRRSNPFSRAALVAVLACILLPPLAVPAEKDAGKANLEEMMAAFMKAASPGPQHELLKSQVGSWESKNTIYAVPGDPQTSQGKAEITAVLGGRFIQENYSGTMMGMPFQGVGLTGYDNIRQKYVSIWMDSLSTGIIMMDGTADASGKTITMTGSYTDPMTGQPIKARVVMSMGDSSRTIEYYETREGKESKAMEAVYTRK